MESPVAAKGHREISKESQGRWRVFSFDVIVGVAKLATVVV